jgi:hypothetical protein
VFRVTGSCPFCPAFSDLGGPVNNSNQDIVPDLRKLFASSITNRYAAGLPSPPYAVLEGTEPAGLLIAAGGRVPDHPHHRDLCSV